MAVWCLRLGELTNVFGCEEGVFFKDEGIEMAWVPGLGSASGEGDVIAGRADIGFLGPEAISCAVDKGDKIQGLNNIYPQNAFNGFTLKHDMPVLMQGAEVYRKAGLIKNLLDVESIFTNELVAEL